MSPLRIAQIAPLWTKVPPVTYGGIELIVHLLTGELIRRGHEVTLFASGDSHTAAKLHPVCDTHMLAHMARTGASVYEYYANAAVAEALRRAADFDILHFHIGTAWLPLGSVSATPSLFTIHTFFSEDDAWAAAHYPQVAIAGISRYQVRELAAHTPVIHNGCDFDSYTPRFEPGSYLAFLGRMGPDKNPLDAIRIAQRAGLPIVLAGEPQQAKEQKYFQENIQPLIDGDRVRHIGPVNHAQKNELLRHAAALIFPIQWPEPFGLVMIEAMACGTPVLAHSLGSVAEVVENGVTGFRADTIAGLDALLPQTLALDRRAVRARARERFGYAWMVDGYERLYRELTGNGSLCSSPET